MDASIFQRFQTSLIEKRHNLVEWLGQTPPAKRQIQLGPADEQAVQVHFQVVGNSIRRRYLVVLYRRHYRGYQSAKRAFW